MGDEPRAPYREGESTPGTGRGVPVFTRRAADLTLLPTTGLPATGPDIQAEPVPEPEPGGGAGETVLIVEDEPAMREVTPQDPVPLRLHRHRRRHRPRGHRDRRKSYR